MSIAAASKRGVTSFLHLFEGSRTSKKIRRQAKEVPTRFAVHYMSGGVTHTAYDRKVHQNPG